MRAHGSRNGRAGSFSVWAQGSDGGNSAPAARLECPQIYYSGLVMSQAFRVVAIPTKVADLVRSSMRSPGYGHPAHVEVATGYGPCRHCLGDFQVGKDRRILFTYDPFYGIEPLPLPGPIFIHAGACERFPDNGGFPPDLRTHRLTLAAYGEGRRLLTEENVENGEVDTTIERLLERSDVKYLHIRDTEAGCYDFRIERVAPASCRTAAGTAALLE